MNASHPRTRLAHWLATHHGAVSAAELAQLGWSRNGVAGLVRRGELIVLRRGVYAAGAQRLTVDGALRVALLAAGPGACVARISSAHRHGHLRFPAPRPEIARWGGRPTRLAHHARVVRLGDLRESDVTCIDGLPMTVPLRNILDLCAAGHEIGGRAPRLAFREAVRQDASLVAALIRRDAERRPWRGRRLLHTLIEELPGTEVLRSGPEADLLAFCSANGLPLPLTNQPVDGLEVDGLWPVPGVVAEVDTRTFHGDPVAFERDRARDTRLAALGLTPVRLTPDRMRGDSDRLATDLFALVSREPRPWTWPERGPSPGMHRHVTER